VEAAIAFVVARPLDLDSLTGLWQRALDAADRALMSAGCSFSSEERALRRHELYDERQATVAALVSLARARHARNLRAELLIRTKGES
jgi:hypothetical protein